MFVAFFNSAHFARLILPVHFYQIDLQNSYAYGWLDLLCSNQPIDN